MLSLSLSPPRQRREATFSFQQDEKDGRRPQQLRAGGEQPASRRLTPTITMLCQKQKRPHKEDRERERERARPLLDSLKGFPPPPAPRDGTAMQETHKEFPWSPAWPTSPLGLLVIRIVYENKRGTVEFPDNFSSVDFSCFARKKKNFKVKLDLR